jgi:dolichol-phosphate mannosyltransferase
VERRAPRLGGLNERCSTGSRVARPIAGSPRPAGQGSAAVHVPATPAQPRFGTNGDVIDGHTRIEWIMTAAPPPLVPTLDRYAAPTSARVPVVSVVIPTRDEADSVDELVERIRRAMATTGAEYEILFVDDSDDGTPRAVAVHERAGAPVRLLHRCPGERSGGLGGARCAGFAAARGEVVVCLDGDLQHPPELLAPMTRLLLDRRADVVVATRYIPGGGVDGLDGVWRRAVSATSRDLARVVLPRLRATSDPGSGCFGFDRIVLDGVVLRPRGFTTLMEVLARGRWERLAEVPYHSAVRGHGRSHATAKEGLRTLRRLVELASDRSLPRRTPVEDRTLHSITLDPSTGPDGPTALVVCSAQSAGMAQVERAARTERRTA